MRLLSVTIFIIALSMNSFAQSEDIKKNESKSKVNLSVDFSNIHTWRGQMSVDRECIKPCVEYNNNNFTIGAWGLYATDNSYEEVDLYIGYKLGQFNFMFYDFYMRAAGDKNKNFFDYSKEAGIHMFDFTVAYTISKNLPLTIMGSATWAANEASFRNFTNEGPYGELDEFSTYIELSYPTELGNTNIKYILGGAPGKSRHARWFDENGRKHYSDGIFYVVNMGVNISHKIKITDNFSLPISAGLTFNPHQEKMFLQFNISLSN